MFKFLTAPVLAVSIAFTGFSTAPVRADEQDVAKFIAGFAALAIIGAAINDSQSSKRVTVHKHYSKPRVQTHRPQVQHQKPKPRAKVVPARCLSHFKTKHGTRRGFGVNCMSKHRKNTATLPHYCKSSFRSKGNTYSYFNAQCLQNAGFRMSRI